MQMRQAVLMLLIAAPAFGEWLGWEESGWRNVVPTTYVGAIPTNGLRQYVAISQISGNQYNYRMLYETPGDQWSMSGGHGTIDPNTGALYFESSGLDRIIFPAPVSSWSGFWYTFQLQTNTPWGGLDFELVTDVAGQYLGGFIGDPQYIQLYNLPPSPFEGDQLQALQHFDESMSNAVPLMLGAVLLGLGVWWARFIIQRILRMLRGAA